MLIHHQESDIVPEIPELAYKVIQPEKIEFISYPYEWSFSQLKDAALLTLAIQKLSLAANMTLKDASAFNIQFHQGAPILIDTLSFEAYQEGTPWVAYRQFCQHFLAPLALMSLKDYRLNRLAQLFIDGIPLDLASRLLPWRTNLNFSLLTHIHLHARAQKHYSGHEGKSQFSRGRFSKMAMIGLIDSLENAVRQLNWKPQGTEWAVYYNATNYSDQALERKIMLVREMIQRVDPKVIWDLGANTGVFSRLGEETADCLVISADVDPAAVEINYLECKRSNIKNVIPLTIDLTNPSPAIGWNNEERKSFIERGAGDLVIVLALIHHLAISNNVPLPDISRFLASLGKYLIIEFVPKEDSQVKRLLASRQDVFPNYTLDGFLQAFSRDFDICQQVLIEGTNRTLFLLGRKVIQGNI